MEPLDNIKKKFSQIDETNKSHSGYDVPGDYFQSLEAKILAQTVDKESEVRSIRRITIPWKFAAIAASLALVIWSISFLNNGDTIDQYSMLDMSQEDSYELLMGDEIDMDTEDFLELEGIDEILDELEQELIVKK